MDESFRIKLSLSFLRISVFIVMLMWTLDKFLRIEHSQTVFTKFYGIPDLGEGFMYGVAL